MTYKVSSGTLNFCSLIHSAVTKVIDFCPLTFQLMSTRLQVAERVAEERGESLGQSVGYQIRLDQWVLSLSAGPQRTADNVGQAL